MAPIPAEDPDNPFDHLAENMAGVDLGSGENMEEALVMDAYKVHRALSGDQSMTSETDPEAPAAIEEKEEPAAPEYKVGDKVAPLLLASSPQCVGLFAVGLCCSLRASVLTVASRVRLAVRRALCAVRRAVYIARGIPATSYLPDAMVDTSGRVLRSRSSWIRTSRGVRVWLNR